MEIRKPNIDYVNSIISIYKNKNWGEIRKIKVKWAYKDENSLSDFEGYLFFEVNLKELISKIDFGAMGMKNIDPKIMFGNSQVSDFRVARILEHWQNGGYIDPPQLCLSPEKRQKLYLADGRHRTITAFHLGEEKIPIAIHESLLNSVSSKIKLIKMHPGFI